MPGAVETGFRPSRTLLAPFSPRRKSRALTMRQQGHGRTPNPAPVILAAAGIQSPYNAPTRSWPPQTPLSPFSPRRKSRAHAMRQHGHGCPKPPSVILAAAEIQSPYNAPTRSWLSRTPLASFSPQRESRAHTMRQHGHGRPKPRSRHSRRSGNPEPIQCANTVMAVPNPARVILVAAGIQSPYNVPTRSWPPQTPLASFSPQRESRAHAMRQHGHGCPEPPSVILAAAGLLLTR